MHYKSIIITSWRSEKELQKKIDETLAEYAGSGWRLHSQSCWYGEYGDNNKSLFSSDLRGNTLKCTLIFEKE